MADKSLAAQYFEVDHEYDVIARENARWDAVKLDAVIAQFRADRKYVFYGDYDFTNGYMRETITWKMNLDGSCERNRVVVIGSYYSSKYWKFNKKGGVE
jgi:hypothetical protein